MKNQLAILRLIALTGTILASVVSFADEPHNYDHDDIISTPQSPPLATDDPGTPGPGIWEINVSARGDFSPGEQRYEIPRLDLNYGIGENLQIKYEVPWVLLKLSESRTYSLDKSNVGIKYNFYDDQGEDIKIAIYPQYQFDNPGSKLLNQGLVVGGPAFFLPLLISKSVNDTTFVFNFGYKFVPNRGPSLDNAYVMSLAAGEQLNHFWSLMGEIQTEWQPAEDIRSGLFTLGTMHEINEDTLWFFSVGRGLGSNADLPISTNILTGFKFITD